MSQITDLENKYVLITGASTGIGAELARAFAAQGARLALHFNSHEAEIRALVAELAGPAPVLVRGDLSRRGEARRVVEEAADRLIPAMRSSVEPGQPIPQRIETAITGHPDRTRLWAAQTPQVVLRQAWLDAAARGDGDETDDAAMLARLGLECAIVEGSPENLKVTRPLDLALAAMILRERGVTACA